MKKIRYIPVPFRASFRLLTLSFLAISLWLSGCASFSGKDLPLRTYADLAPAPEEKMCLVTQPSSSISGESREVVDTTFAMLEKSGFFLKAPEHCTPDEKEIHNSIKWDFHNDTPAGNKAFAIMSGFICGFTFTLVPGFERDELQLKVQFRKNDQLVKDYVYRERVDTWIHLSMLVMMLNHHPRDTVREIYERMVMNFLYDYSHDVQSAKNVAAAPLKDGQH